MTDHHIIDEERDEIIAALPRKATGFCPTTTNAFVYIDTTGRLCILPKDGGWLGIEQKNFQHLLGDIAPFCD
jgi:hypothetical protein